MPFIIEDKVGRVHVFWYGDEDKDTKSPPLLYSQMLVGSTIWSPAQNIAESAIAFDVSTPPSGELTLSYIRGLNSAIAPSGVYFKRLPATGLIWSTPVPIYESIYYRLITPEDAWLRSADTGKGFSHLVWLDPRQKTPLYSFSLDGGLTWSMAETLSDANERILNPRVATLSAAPLRIWQANLLECTLLQQEDVQMKVVSAIPITPTTTLTETTIVTSTTILTPTWSTPAPIVPGLTTCPADDLFFYQNEKDSLFWLWGLGSSNLYLVALRAGDEQWTEPININVRFQDPETGHQIVLTDLHTIFTKDEIVIIGTEPDGGEVLGE